MAQDALNYDNPTGLIEGSMIQKIISGGQTGADQAALDIAIKLGIPHGGWVPKGRLTEDGPLAEKYDMKEMPTDSHPERTEQNVIDSQGTVIFSHGDLTEGSAFTEEMAKKHGRPYLHIDLERTTAFDAAVKINDLIRVHKVEILNVAGPRASKDPRIYKAVKDILEVVLNLNSTGTDLAARESLSPNHPKTVHEAVDRLLAEMTLKDKIIIAKMEENELSSLSPNLSLYIRDKFRILPGNEDLINSCRLLLKKYDISGNEASASIIRELWKKLRKSHTLRAVK